MKDRPDLDYANSEKRDPEWTDLIVEMFNDADVELRTRVVKDLHENFAESIDCPKGSYILSIDKAKDLLQDMKSRLRDIVRRYNASGNGSDMRICEYDSDDERLIEENEDTYGRFNQEREP